MGGKRIWLAMQNLFGISWDDLCASFSVKYDQIWCSVRPCKNPSYRHCLRCKYNWSFMFLYEKFCSFLKRICEFCSKFKPAVWYLGKNDTLKDNRVE